MASVLLDEILAHLKLLGQEERYKQQAVLALDLFNRVVLKADLNQPSLANLAFNLWVLAHKQGCLDTKLSVNFPTRKLFQLTFFFQQQRTKDFLQRRANTKGSDNYIALISRLNIPK